MNLKDDNIKDLVVDLDNKGLSQIEISKQTGIPTSTLGDFLRKESYLSWWDSSADRESIPEGAVIRVIDIENTPMLLAGWGLFNQNFGINQIIEDWYILSYAVKTLHIDDAVCYGLDDFPDYTSGGNMEILLVEKLWKELDEADYIIAHNGKAFDNKKIKAKFLEYGFPIPSPYRVIDTLKIAKDNFRLSSNKLDYILRLLEKAGKLDAGGMETWLGCMNGCPESWKTMKTYNLQDTTELEEVYLDIRHWDTKHPNVANFINDGVERCTVCASDNLKLCDTDSKTNLSTFDTLTCGSCGHQNRRRKNKKDKTQMQATLMNSVSD